MTISRAGNSLGAVLAGGMSRRFGSPKAFAEVGGVPIVARVLAALAETVPELVVIANQPAPFEPLGVEVVRDDLPGLGALGGLRTALALARRRGRPGALCLACDMPFVTPAVLRMVLAQAGRGAAAVVPESGGRRGMEPLCAWYSVECLAAVDRLLAREERSLVALLERVPTGRVPLAEVERAGDPEVLFLNVNTAEDHWRAILIASDPDHARTG